MGRPGGPGHVGEGPPIIWGHFIQRGALFVGTAEKALQAAVDKARVAGGQVGIAEAQLAHGAGAEVLDDHIGVVDEPVGEFLARILLEVNAKAVLVAVVHGEVAAAGALQTAGVVPADGLHLQHLGAEVGQDQTGRRTHDHVRKLDHADVAQGQVAQASPYYFRRRQPALRSN